MNNAGVGNGGAIDWLTMDNFRFDMEVNYYGMVRLTKGCLPLLKAAAVARARGGAGAPSHAPRLVNVTSCAGLMPVPFMSPYCASKHAAEVRRNHRRHSRH